MPAVNQSSSKLSETTPLLAHSPAEPLASHSRSDADADADPGTGMADQASYTTSHHTPTLKNADVDHEAWPEEREQPAGALPVPPADTHHGLHRGLSARQVSMIAIAGTIGTGLFLGTGRSLAQGGPASMLICYALVGFIVYVTLLLLGEMATQYPVAGECASAFFPARGCGEAARDLDLLYMLTLVLGSFNAYATRFFSPSYGFALSWNYWFNDAVSVASDLTAAQLVLQFWTPWHSWVISLLFWVFLVGVNSIHVRAYGELGQRNLLSLAITSANRTDGDQNIGYRRSK